MRDEASTCKAGKLYGVSVGPGDPELLTLKAVRVLREVDYVAAPETGGSARVALGIVERYVKPSQIVDCPTPMTGVPVQAATAYDAIAERLAGMLDAGKSVAFITLGDASVYSTWSYVCRRMLARGYDIEVVPGVTSFCAAAAELRESLCDGSEELLVSPVAAGNPEAALDRPGTKVFMKSGKRLNDLCDLLRARGNAENASLVANCGLENQRVATTLDDVEDLPGYLSVVIVKDPA